MITHVTVELNNEEIDQISVTYDLLTEMYNELIASEKTNKEAIKLINDTQENLDQIIYKFCNEDYREAHY